jgi:PTH1 family peptidyl-tRNA hydrolase
MIVAVGLGNPDKTHLRNRHNVGYLVIDELARAIGDDNWHKVKKNKVKFIKSNDLILVKPTTYMNDSGDAVKKIIDQYNINITNLWVIHDDLDIKLGKYKIQKGKGPRLHNGLKSIYNKIGNKNFWHVRVGVDSRVNGDKIPGETYVLSDFTDEQMVILLNTIDIIVDRLISLFEENGIK